MEKVLSPFVRGSSRALTSRLARAAAFKYNDYDLENQKKASYSSLASSRSEQFGKAFNFSRAAKLPAKLKLGCDLSQPIEGFPLGFRLLGARSMASWKMEKIIKNHEKEQKKEEEKRNRKIEKKRKNLKSNLLKLIKDNPTYYGSPLSDYLREAISRGPLTAEQFDLFRVNFLVRTEGTIATAADAVKRSIKHISSEYDDDTGTKKSNYDVMLRALHNTMEEGGGGKPENIHLHLLERLLNYIGKVLYGLEPITIEEAKKSPAVVKEVWDYKIIQEKVLDSKTPDALVAGWAAVQENYASNMLRFIKEVFYDSVKDELCAATSEEEYKEMGRYFDEHLEEPEPGVTPVEERHGEDAIDTLVDLIMADPECKKHAMIGVELFPSSQGNMWSGIAREMKKLEVPSTVVTSPLPPLPTKVEKLV